MSNPAPGALEMVRGFVNTFDAEDVTDDIETPEQLHAWLAGNGLGVEAVSKAEHARALAVRDALRGVLRAHHGHPDEELEPTVLAEASERARLQLRFDDDGASRLEPAAAGVDG